MSDTSSYPRTAMDAVSALLPAGVDIAITLCVPGDVTGFQAHFCCHGDRARLHEALVSLLPGTGQRQHESPRPMAGIELVPRGDGLPDLVEVTALIPLLREALADALTFRKANDVIAFNTGDRALRLAQLETLGRFVDLLEGK